MKPQLVRPEILRAARWRRQRRQQDMPRCFLSPVHGRIAGAPVTLTRWPYMLSSRDKQAFSMSAIASSTAAVAPNQRHAQAPVAASVTHVEMANAIRALAMDAVEQAKSGHPGMPMGMADVATVLFSHFLKFDPTDPAWPDRDRFVLSAGHGSMLIYALLYLTGYEQMTLEEIKRFRQLDSITAGHPEF